MKRDYLRGGLIGALIGVGVVMTGRVGRDYSLSVNNVPDSESSVLIFEKSKANFKVGEVEQDNSKPEEKRDCALLSRSYINAIIRIESAGNPRAESHVGARGLMQIMPETWKEESRKLYGEPLDFEKAFDPEINRKVGEFYLNTIRNYLSKRIKGWENLDVSDKQDLIAAAYNGGMGRVVRNMGDISKMPSETRNYVEKFDRLRSSLE